MGNQRIRLAPLDVATIVVLAAAVYLFVRPGSALHASTSQWLAFRRVEQATAKNWTEIASIAQPLYAGAATPDLIVFSDYECPFCRAAYPVIDSAIERGVRLAMVHLPLDIHPMAPAASRAALCAVKGGKYRDVDRWLMTSTAWRTDSAVLLNAPVPGGAESVLFAGCVKHGETGRLLQTHVDLAKRIGVAATPTIVSRRHILRGRPTTQALVAMAADR